ncbi:MAG: glycosyltransferase family 1 protein [Pyrinomonadaceae bacterium]|nr:glycosyltransferase family 1 protein [Phycisphaerales bacterium]
MRLCLFTDTLADINGVSRFIRSIADQAPALGRDLQIITSTRLECPPRDNIHNVRPVYARAMPGYPELELVWPDVRSIMRLADSLRPDVVHVSTPGPVGLAGRRFAKLRGVPLVGTYHTDFPAYIDHLFCDRSLTWLTAQAMRRFYRTFDRLFTRSTDYMRAMGRLGISADRIVRLLPGIDTDTFHTRHRDPSVWTGFPGIRKADVKVLYVGRVSIEKNLPMLAGAWKIATAADPTLHLVIIGDGPYRSAMETQVRGEVAGAEAEVGGRTSFLGFRHGDELSRLYASADLFVFPSTTDTLGQVVMEAQSSGLPVIVTDQGGPSEVVNHCEGVDQSGIVLPADNPARWASEIVRLAGNPELRARLGAAGHRKIQSMSIRCSFEHFWQIHENTLHRHLTKS